MRDGSHRGEGCRSCRDLANTVARAGQMLPASGRWTAHPPGGRECRSTWREPVQVVGEQVGCGEGQVISGPSLRMARPAHGPVCTRSVLLCAQPALCVACSALHSVRSALGPVCARPTQRMVHSAHGPLYTRPHSYVQKKNELVL